MTDYDEGFIRNIRADVMAAHAALANGDEDGVRLVLGWAMDHHPEVVIWTLLHNVKDLGEELHGDKGWKEGLMLWRDQQEGHSPGEPETDSADLVDGAGHS